MYSRKAFSIHSFNVMKNKISIPEEINQRTTYKKKVTLSDLYHSLLFATPSSFIFIRNKKIKTVNEQFLERLQLAVTEVSACAVCSYAHTKMALDLGLSNEEITAFLSGNNIFQKENEAKAILFAQHYAETRGKGTKTSYEKIVQEYGEEKSRIILAAIQLMLMGNMIGLPMSALRARKSGNPYKDSSLGYELGMLFATLLMLPLVFTHSFLRWLLRKPFLEKNS